MPADKSRSLTSARIVTGSSTVAVLVGLWDMTLTATIRGSEGKLE